MTKDFERDVLWSFGVDADDLDKEFSEHLVYVFNQSIQAVRYTGFTPETLQKVGKMGLRLYGVFGAYKAKKKQYSAENWLARVDAVAKEIIGAIGRG